MQFTYLYIDKAQGKGLEMWLTQKLENILKIRKYNDK